MRKILIATALCATFGLGTAFAEPVQVVIASGGTRGTYYPVVEEIAKFCNSSTLEVSHYQDPNRKEDPTGGGSVANLQRVTNNLSTAGLVQTDVAALEMLGKNPAMARVLALLPLHTEHLHFIIPTTVSVMTQEETKGFLGVGSKPAVYEERPNELRSVADLKGAVVAAWGGSVVSAQVVEQLGRLGASVVDAGNEETAMSKLESGEVQAVLAVAGAPVKWISELPKGKYSLLAIGDSIKESMSAVYGTQSVSYNNMGDTGQRLEALTVNALLMTRTYRTDDMVGALSELQACVRAKIAEIQDTAGTHPAWQAIDPNIDMKWDNVFSPPANFVYNGG